MKNKSWYSITNKSESLAEIAIYDEIGIFGITAKDFLNELRAVGDRRILMRINSPGGDVFDGLAIYNRLRDHAPGVEVRVDGVAASMASVIAMCGTPLTMAENALMMIHNPSGFCMGDSNDMRDLADVLDKIQGSLAGAYVAKSGKSHDDVIAMMEKETWLNAEDAQELGFIDGITEPLKMAARFDMSKFRNSPTHTAMNPLRTSILALLSLSDPSDKPLSDEQISGALGKALGDAKANLDLLTTANSDLVSARSEIEELKGKLAPAESKALASEEKFGKIVSAVKTALGLTEEQVANLTSDITIIPVAVATEAGKKAIEIAASQGVPALPTAPVSHGEDGGIKEAFATAAKEPDPRKRGEMFAAASAHLARSANKTGNN